MKYAVIENGLVTNVILADAGFSLAGKTLVRSDTANINDTYDGAVFIAPPVPPAREPTKTEKIAAIEAQQTPRRVREAVLGKDAGWLASLDEQIVSLRAQP